MTEDELNYLVREANGKATVAAYIRSKLFGKGMRNHDVLRQVAALHEVGMSLRMLARASPRHEDQANAAIAAAKSAIEHLADHFGQDRP